MRAWGRFVRRGGAAVAALGAVGMVASADPDPASATGPAFVWQDAGSPAGLPTTLASTKNPEVKVSFYGFLDGSFAFEESRMSLSAQLPVFTLPEDRAAIGVFTGAVGNGQGRAIFNPRLTRFGVNVAGPAIEQLGDAKPSGQFEIDFYGGGVESRALPRMRKAWAQLKGDAFGEGNWWLFRIGQDADLISQILPSVNHDMVFWGAGNPGDRRPQARLELNLGPVLFGAMAGLSGAVSDPNLDGGALDGEVSEQPTLQLRAAWSANLLGTAKPMTVALWGHRGWFQTDAIAPGVYGSWGYGLELVFPLVRDGEEKRDLLWIQAEFWRAGSGVDIRTGVLQARNPATGIGVASTGGWIELGTQWNGWLKLHGGYAVDDPDNEDLVGFASVAPARPPGVAANQTVYGGFILDFAPCEIRFEVLWNRTHYLGRETRIVSGQDWAPATAFRYLLGLRVNF